MRWGPLMWQDKMASAESCEAVTNSTKPQPGDSSLAMTWRQVVTSLYPEALSRTYTVPPLHFNRVPYVSVTAPGTSQDVLVVQHPQSAGVTTSTPAKGKRKRKAKKEAPSQSSANITLPGIYVNTTLPVSHVNITLPVSFVNTTLPVSHVNITLPISFVNTTLPVGHVNTTLPVSHVNTTLPVGHVNTTLPVSHVNTTLPVGHVNTTLSVSHVNTTLPVGHVNTTLPVSHVNTTLPVGHVNTTLPVSHVNTTLPVGHVNTTLPVSHVNTTLPVSHVNTTLPVSHVNTTLPVSHVNTTLPVGHVNTTLPVSHVNTTLPVSHVNTTLPVGHVNTTLPVSHVNTTLPVSHVNTTLPVSHVNTTLPVSHVNTTLPVSGQCGSQVTQPVRVQESDLRDDFAQQHVLYNLQALGRADQQTMFILSQLNYGDYLNKPSYTAAFVAAQISVLPRPSNLGIDGDFDILIIHRQYGILVGELKAVGRNWSVLNKTQAEADADVATRVRNAVSQLDKSGTLVKHLVSDIAPSLTVRKTLFLPYVSNTQLQRVLEGHPQLQQVLCSSMDVTTTAEAVQLCCCSDLLSHPDNFWHVTPDVLTRLRTWWYHRMTSYTDPLLIDQVYLDIVARFVGPATSVTVHCTVPPRVEVRTEGEAVAELGRRLTRLVLTPQQLDLLNRSPPLAFLTGPPGTGKTVMLVLKGLQWLHQGHDVYVVSLGYATLAASLMIQNQLQMTLQANSTTRSATGRVYVHQYKDDVSVSELTAAAQGGSLHIFLDEASWSDTSTLDQLVTTLCEQVPHLYLWAAGIHHKGKPRQLQTEVMTQPLRCAPAVLREVKTEIERWRGQVLCYSDNSLPAPGDGPSVIKLYHHGDTHYGRYLTDCPQCGQDVAAVLRRLGVGNNGTDQLNYRDVFVLSHVEVSPDDGFVRGLRDAGVPVSVLENCPSDSADDVARWERQVADVAVAATDCVTVTDYNNVQGLERHVVVCLKWEGRDILSDKLLSPSRCSTQLVMVYNVPQRR